MNTWVLYLKEEKITWENDKSSWNWKASALGCLQYDDSEGHSHGAQETSG